MSNTVLKCQALITSITINGIVYAPDGSGLITIPSGDATTLFRGNNFALPPGANPISIAKVPTDPTT